tara:strand:- start:57 stop:431 length:375 start_codon:yes stop_codon:yes gene_type:complete
MDMIKIRKIDSSSDTANTASYVNGERFTAGVVAATTATFDYASAAGAVKDLVFTVTGADTAEKLLNAQRCADYFATVLQQVAGTGALHKGVFDLGNQAAITAAAGLTFTGASTEPLVSVALTVD